MPISADTKEYLKKAQERAALEIESWVPEKVGDNVSGVILELGSMEVDVLGTVPTTLVETEKGKVYRISWGGAIGRSSWGRLDPQPGDIMAAHYHGDITPKQAGFNNYQNISYVVLNPDGTPKRPANLQPPHNVNTDGVISNNDDDGTTYQERVLSKPDESFPDES